MSELLEGDERLERELTGEPVKMPAAGSVLLHLGLAGSIVAYYILGGFLHSNLWGGPNAGGAIQVQITSAIPLPSQQPPNNNVLATDTPSPAPAPPAPKAAPIIDDKAIPILGKNAKEKPKPTPAPPQKIQQPPVPTNKAQYGEQAASSVPKAIQGQSTVQGPVTVNEGDFGSRFGYYISNIQRKMKTNLNMSAVDPRTPKGTRSYILFTVHRDGTVSDVRLDRSSGVPTLDRECLRGAQRVDTFGPLPTAYLGSTVLTSYYCEY
jgi:protein TonB